MSDLQLFPLKESTTALPFFLSAIRAGFPSPADDYLEEMLSLDDICISNPASTFLGRVIGDSLKDICIYQGDILVIDKAPTPENRNLVVCAIDGEFTAKILHKEKGCISLHAANPQFKPIIIKELTDFKVWGVIRFVIQNVQYRSNDWNY